MTLLIVKLIVLPLLKKAAKRTDTTVDDNLVTVVEVALANGDVASVVKRLFK